jgi:hypothetical protein
LIFNADVPDVTYFYNSWLPYNAKNSVNANNPAINPALGANIDGSAGVSGFHFHAAEKRAVRLTYGVKVEIPCPLEPSRRSGPKERSIETDT